MNAIVLNMIHFFHALFLLLYSPTTGLIIFLLSKQVISHWIYFFLRKNLWSFREWRYAKRNNRSAVL